MRFHLLLAIFSFGIASSFAYANGDKPDFFVPFWYAGASVAHQIKNGPSQCEGLNRIIDGLHLGYQFSPYLMTEVEYQYLGCMVTSEQLNRDMIQGTVNTKLGYPVANNITPYLKVGVGGKVNGIAGLMGLGLSYRVSDDVALNMEYQYTTLISNSEFVHQRFSLGIQYRFSYATPRVITIEKPFVHDVTTERMVEVEKIPQFETVVKTNIQVVLFENNSSMLINTKALLPIVILLKMHLDTKVRITGYTDSTGSEKYNQWLSSMRAKNVGDYLINQGISSGRVVILSKGELDPISSNSTVNGRAMNRRVSIELN
ncbi:OmpA family protein [Aliivibrio fischeri]|uniref:OmpA family protein n=1 Tax=Aliivibrio fischeri TaxID=668 RepID=A0A510UML6_ALIFS|nr:OmpA family protein [Aliivibrio fischeri]MUK51224.1 OmpA family protein [Aliivibrio fischeri]GEK15922.1 outer membrane protein A [Aliivibrio fischeri]